MSLRGYLGIDAGTQGLSVLWTDEELNVIEVGEASYEMVPGLAAECYEQSPDHWIEALQQAMLMLKEKLSAEEREREILAIGISGQMHGEVLADAEGNSLGPARLWCDARNENEGDELTGLFGAKMPKRATASRWLWTIRHQPEKALQAKHMTTPAGWIGYALTGQWTLGIGDAAGMFPIDQETLNYNQEFLARFGTLVEDSSITPLEDLLPSVRKAGEDAGSLNARGGELLGLPVGIPVAPPEGDQPAALAGSLIGDAGMVSVSFGTSVCANSVGDRPFQGVNRAVDHFCAVDGKPINMVWLRNGTTYMNSVVNMFEQAGQSESSTRFADLIAMAVDAEPNCGGVVALPFMDDEPGLGVSHGGSAMLAGLNSGNATPGNAIKAALLSTMFNLRLGSEVLDGQGYPRNQLVLSGGLTKSPELGQVLADVYNARVSLLASAEEGTAWGAALMAKYRREVIDGASRTWAEFLKEQGGSDPREFEPDSEAVPQYEVAYQRYKKLVALQAAVSESIA